ncbi:MAG: hypothetical protein WC464_02445 [Bdellovibrionales bacterium]
MGMGDYIESLQNKVTEDGVVIEFIGGQKGSKESTDFVPSEHGPSQRLGTQAVLAEKPDRPAFVAVDLYEMSRNEK